MIVQSLAFATGVAGLILASLGLIGRRVGDRQLCRACGYDVADIIEEHHNCPECGHSIRGPKGTMQGKRTRRMGLMIAGLFMLAPASATGWYISTVTQPLSTRPTWLMAATLWAGPPSQNRGIARELGSRWRAGQLDRVSRWALIDWGLDPWASQHESRSWQHAEISRLALVGGHLSDREQSAFVTQLLRDASDTTNTARQRLALTVTADIRGYIRPQLESALQSAELRESAVMVLLDDLVSAPTQPLIEAAMETLAARPGEPETGPASDRLPIPISTRRGVRYLTHHAKVCAPVLREALLSTNAQTRLLSAVMLTSASNPEHDAAIGRTVAPFLEPNETPGDALLATRALLRAGAPAIHAAQTSTNHPQALMKLEELADAARRGVPPHLERLAGPLPWED